VKLDFIVACLPFVSEARDVDAISGFVNRLPRGARRTFADGLLDTAKFAPGGEFETVSFGLP